MKKLLTLLMSLLIGSLLTAQIAYSPVVEGLLDEVTETGITTMLEQLSGEVEVNIGGQPYTIVTRHSFEPGNAMSAQWIKEQFEALGIAVEYHYFGTNGENVVATITGSQFPDQQYIICAHYDDMPSGPVAPGADDNASGVVGVIETARIIKDMDLRYTLKFIAFDEEEQGLIGSNAYANEAAANGDDILGVLNLDMIAYDSDNDYEMSISTIPESADFTTDYTTVLGLYPLDLTYNYISTGASDHSPFWNNDYQAILAIEDWNDFNDAYHTTGDLVSNCNIPYFKQMVQSAVATMASHGMDLKMELEHEPLLSGSNSGDREAYVIITSNHEMASGNNAPRLYYSVNSGSFNHLLPNYINQDTFFFMIPGQPIGTQVDYYFAAQNEGATMIATLPSGGYGISPPGTTPPGDYFTYQVDYISTLFNCSETLPKPINDLTFLYDTIHISQDGTLDDLNVEIDITHTYCGDVEIYLVGPDGTQIDLCVGHGGSGNNFTGTILDDEADTPIAQGSPPFSGRYIPDEPLASFQNLSTIKGDWVLVVFDNALNDDGQLNNWCLDMQYLVGTDELEESKLTIHQNYPNPFSESTNFSFDLEEKSDIHISILDMMGREIQTVCSQEYPAGSHSVSWQAEGIPAGQYFYRVQSNDAVTVKPMIIVK